MACCLLLCQDRWCLAAIRRLPMSKIDRLAHILRGPQYRRYRVGLWVAHLL